MRSITIGKLRTLKNIIKSFGIFMVKEFRRGTLKENFPGFFSMNISRDMSWGELMEEQARKYKKKTFLIFEDKEYSYIDMNDNASRAANYFKSLGGGKGDGVALFMENSPSFLDAFIGLQKIGMYSVPVNTSLVGDSLLYILNHCDAKFLLIDDTMLPVLEKIRDRLENIETIIVNVTEEKSMGGKKRDTRLSRRPADRLPCCLKIRMVPITGMIFVLLPIPREPRDFRRVWSTGTAIPMLRYYPW